MHRRHFCIRGPGLLLLPLLLLAQLPGCRSNGGNPGEAEAVALIEKLGGKVERNETAPEKNVIKVYLHSTKVQDSDLALVKKLPNLQNLFLGRTSISDAGLEQLAGANTLTTLSLNATSVTDTGLKPLAGLKNLKTLNVQDTKVTAAGIAELKQALPGLNVGGGK